MSKYDPLRDHLKRVTAASVVMTFAEIDTLFPLPLSATRHPAWWRNEGADGARHVQSRAWMSAGFKAEADLQNKVVIFRRD